MSVAEKTDPRSRDEGLAPAADYPVAARMNERAQRLARRVALGTVLIPFAGFVAAVALLWGQGVGVIELCLLAGMYAATVLGVGVGFHRLVTHRAFQTGGALKVVLVVLGSMAAEGPVLFWAATHRRHHSFSDRAGDPHSPYVQGEAPLGSLRGFWHAHTGWMFEPELTGWVYYVPDLLRDKLIFRLNTLYFVWVAAGLLIPTALGGLLRWSWAGAFYGLLWGGLVRIFLAHHTTWSINSVCHMYGSRPFHNRDHSANNFLMALISFGEGWHNNHHAFPSSARHGLRWWEIDVSGYVIRLLEKAGLAWNVKAPTPRMIAEAQQKS